MLLWSLWLATALVRWLPWAWRQLSAGGFWPAPANLVTPDINTAVADQEVVQQDVVDKEIVDQEVVDHKIAKDDLTDKT
jgi:hypothetical protein